MTNERISPRLQALAQWVPRHSLFADIGTDHGYLPLFLLHEQQIRSAIAADLNQGPLDAAKQTAQKYGITLDLRLSNGLDKISPKEVDCVAIAGMGGMTILHILQAWQAKLENWPGTFLLQPMSTQKELRLWLNQSGYTMVREQTICEGDTLYTLMEVKIEKDSAYDVGELLVGRQNPQHPDPNRLLLLDLHLNKIEKILAKLPDTLDATARKKEVLEQREALLAMREEWNTWQSQ